MGSGAKRVRYLIFTNNNHKSPGPSRFFVLEMAGISIEGTSKDQKWLLHVDGSSTIQGSGAGIVITSPSEDLEFAVKFDFKASNNEAECEALVIGMKMAHEAGLDTFSHTQIRS
ncbi:UNVERIFIED_CONTAM: hypothetical protein Slati_2542700 [Sesamum latifolium]|uniref:RNase H type-1 domain-containing protein n=1 Tax=Sesamum latifolium TaxID=2727402 RepID=A0AAW2WJE1_9LAMI